MKHEHAMCQANDIEQKRLLGGNPAQKKNQICFLFPLSFIFRILLCFFRSLIFLFFYFNIEDNVVFWFSLLFFFKKKESKFYLLNSHWFMII